MVIELVSHHLGFRRVNPPLTLEDFRRSRKTIYIVSGGEHIEATPENWQPGDEAFTRLDLGQYRLIVDGRQVGYVSKDKPGAIMLTERVDDATRDAIEMGVAEQLGIETSSQMPVDLHHVEETAGDDDEDDDSTIWTPSSFAKGDQDGE